MKITVLFDKEKSDARCEVGWGIAYAVGEQTLFDTGEKFEYLGANAGHLDFDLAKIKNIVISHEHWDHTGGLEGLLKLQPQRTVFGCQHFSNELKERVQNTGALFKEIKGITAIDEGIYSSGESFANYKGTIIYEQSLVLTVKGGLVVLVGCAHSGIVNVLQKVKNTFRKEILCVMGGFHLMDKEKRFMEYIVEQITKLTVSVGPSHCSGYEAQGMLREAFGDKYIEVAVGKTMEW